MFELENEVRRWRRALDRRSSLAPRELDELEDHLRARVDLELELDAALSPTEAFAIARRDLGEPKALSREFARSGRPRWKPLLAGALALYSASLLLPVLHMQLLPASWGFEAWVPRGYELLADIELLPLNLPMLLMLPLIWRKPRLKGTWLAGILGVIGLSALGLGVAAVIDGGSDALSSLRPGYWAWAASFVCASAALWFRRRGWASARPKTSIA
ncbi:MAG: hypothetical protein OXI39_05485 [Gemmatimonadota bacterium]|uniref:hypothetical protein n=1 Tax=Candidatus Palauibacter scopulicola TaxID=3056741 RepID=UPI0023A6240E|nr:hypothetical protein [Candidatus Palauibacter scopulicola]MDE2662441.1 hypothetical protein [Candidatus Palauibacter scopulicola]